MTRNTSAHVVEILFSVRQHFCNYISFRLFAPVAICVGVNFCGLQQSDVMIGGMLLKGDYFSVSVVHDFFFIKYKFSDLDFIELDFSELEFIEYYFKFNTIR